MSESSFRGVRPVFIVLEGVDNSGKSTLARRMCNIAKDKFNWTSEVWHRGVPVRHPLEEYETDLENDYAFHDDSSDTHLIVADRWHLGQYVYGGLYRDNNILGDAGLWHVDARLRSIGTLQMILDAPTQLVIDRENAGKTEDWQVSADAGYLKMTDVDRVRERYFECAARYDVPIQTSDFSDEDLSDILENALEHHRLSRHTRQSKTYVGPPRPRAILFGEKRGFDEASSIPRGACFAPYAATSGRWLIESLLLMPKESYRDLGLANALEEDVPQLLEDLGYPQVCALGTAASHYLTSIGVSHGRVPHPQYMRRFANKDQEQYARSIAEAIRDQTSVGLTSSYR